MAKLNKIAKENLVYLDETGIDDNEEYKYAWSPKGSRACAKKKGKKERRFSIIGAWSNGKIIALFIFEGPCTRDLVESWLKKELLPILEPGKTLVMDNASFHKGGKIEKIIENAGSSLLYLSPYSPELNPIEKGWSWIKSRTRKLLPSFDRDLFKVANFGFL